jgi:plasmid stability protein
MRKGITVQAAAHGSARTEGIEILTALKSADMNPDALVFATRKGTPMSRRVSSTRMEFAQCISIRSDILWPIAASCILSR